MYKAPFIPLLLLIVATGMAGAPKPVTLRFQAQVGDAAFACGREYSGVGVTKSHISARDFRFQARADRWIFLTGSLEALDRVCADGLDLTLVTGDQGHSTRFALVDRKARVRGYYNSSDSEAMKSLVAGGKTLVAQ